MVVHFVGWVLFLHYIFSGLQLFLYYDYVTLFHVIVVVMLLLFLCYHLFKKKIKILHKNYKYTKNACYFLLM